MEKKAVIKIYTEENEDTIYYNDDIFEDQFEPEWLQDQYVRRVISEIDKGEIIGDYAIKVDDYGIISPFMLLSGSKTLIMLKFVDNFIFNGSLMGNNCISLLVDLDREKDLEIMLWHFPPIYGFKNIKYVFPEINKETYDEYEYSRILDRLLVARAHGEGVNDI